MRLDTYYYWNSSFVLLDTDYDWNSSFVRLDTDYDWNSSFVRLDSTTTGTAALCGLIQNRPTDSYLFDICLWRDDFF